MMAAEIILSRKNLTHVYISHFHPDHHFGLVVLRNAFPRAKIVALPSVVSDIVFTSSDKIDTWSIDRFGPDTPATTTIPVPLSQPRLELEGADILLSDDWEGDSVNNSAVWVPSMRVLCATDIAFDDWHVWFIESDVKRRVKWRAALGDSGFDARGHPGHGSEKTMDVLGRAAKTNVSCHLVHRLDAGTSTSTKGCTRRRDRESNWWNASETGTRRSRATISQSSGSLGFSTPRVAPSGSPRCQANPGRYS
jgi:glyoxylase-like metal-dependent hydrolase (beta-lactamase superfamily II)